MSSVGGSVSVYVGSAAATVAAVAVVAVVALGIPGVTGGSGSATANLWVDTNGGTCTRQGTAAAYSDSAACSTFDACWDAMSVGDTCRVRPGTYAEQVVNGNKTTPGASIIGDGDGDDVLIGNGGAGADCSSSWSALCADANFLTVENVTTVVTDPGPAGGLAVNGTNVTVRDFHAKGGVNGASLWGASVGIQATGFLWDRGSLGHTDATENLLCTHSAVEPLWFQSGGDNAVIQYVTVGLYDAIVGAGAACGGDNVPHIETIRFEDADNVTLRGNTFSGPSDAGSGHVFTSSDPNTIVFANNVFEDRGIGNAWMQTGGTPSGWTWLYNTFLDTGGRSSNVSTEVFAGNFGYSPGCGSTDIKNVYSGSGSCGTSTYFGATAFGLDANNHVQAGSPAIDTAETPDASDHCTGSVVNSLDIDGDSRPFGGTGNCTAGADEPTS